MGKKKTKKPIWKRILKWSGITFLVLLLIIILIPYLFKDQIVALIKEQANENLNAVVDFNEVELTFLSTFPNLTLTINDLVITGKDQFEGDTLISIGQTNLKLDFWNAVGGDQYQIDAVELIDPIINIHVLPDGSANYDIALSDSTATVTDEETAPFKLALENYSITNGDITYNDEYSVTYVHLAGLTHSGNVVIDDVVYTLETQTKSTDLTFSYDQIDYLYNSNSEIACNLEIAMPEEHMKITFKENQAKINALKLHFDGSMLMTDTDMDFDFTFNTLDQSFKSLLSVVPGVFSPDFGAIKTDGEIDLSGSFTGKMNETDMPGFELITSIDDAYLQYPGLPESIKDINVDLKISRKEGPDLNNIKVDLSTLKLAFLENKINASLQVSNIMTDPAIKSNLISYVNLSELNQAFPLSATDTYTGIINSDISLAGKLSSIENEKYEDFDAKGNLRIKEMAYNTPSLPYTVNIDSLHFIFSPANLKLANFSSRIGASDISATGDIDNYLGYLLKSDTLRGEFNVFSKLLNLDELMGTTTSASTETENKDGSTDVLETPVSDPNAEVAMIPGNINFALNTKMDEVMYDGLALKNVGGSVLLKDSKATVQNVTMGVFNGTIVMNGDYYAENSKEAIVNFDYDIKDLSFKESFEYFNTVQKFAPFTKYFEGNFSTKMNFSGKLDNQYYPIYSTISGLGNATSNRVKITEAPMLQKLAETIKLDELKSQTIDNLDISYEFKDGKIWIEETPFKLSGYPATISGTTSFTQELAYKINSEIPSSAFGSTANEMLMGLASKLSSSTGTEVKIPTKIPLEINIGGTLLAPEMSTNLKDIGKETTQNLVDQGKEIIIEKVTDAAKKILEKAQAEADALLAKAKTQADSIRSKTDEIAANIETKADSAHKVAIAEIENAAIKATQEAYAASQKGVDEASNPIAKKAAEKLKEKLDEATDTKVAATKKTATTKADNAKKTAYKNAETTRTEGEEKAVKIEGTAQTGAETIMTNANKKVDNLDK
ncbi:MAG: hypothetical protein ACI8Q1_000422 [Parvicella sp.]|jgi:hypothetical protein